MTRNQLYNFPHQGPGFHCLLWSIIEITKWVKQHASLLCGEIHDDLFWDGKPSEFKTIREKVDKVMLDDIRGANPWIIVPLATEWKCGKNWLSYDEKTNPEGMREVA